MPIITDLLLSAGPEDFEDTLKMIKVLSLLGSEAKPAISVLEKLLHSENREVRGAAQAALKEVRQK